MSLVPTPTVVKYQTPPKVAFVSGVNGISGHAIVEQLIRRPESEWSKIILSSRSPLPNYWADHRIDFIAVDFLKPIMQNIEKLRLICADVTHVYYTSYVHSADMKVLPEKNVPLLKNFVNVIEAVAPNMQRICIYTGGKYYGPHIGHIRPPAEETHPRYEDKGENFYYAQEDFLAEAQARQNTWSWNVIRPAGILGFTPQANGMSEAFTVAVYFLLCRELDQPPHYPGNENTWKGVYQKSHAPGIADLAIFATTHDHCANQAFNHTNGDIMIWRTTWPNLAAYWGSKSPEPEFKNAVKDSRGLTLEFDVVEWAKDKQEVWDTIVAKYGGKREAFAWAGWAHMNWVLGRAVTTLLSLDKARKFGWTRYDSTYDSWVSAFKTMQAAGILPGNRLISQD